MKKLSVAFIEMCGLNLLQIKNSRSLSYLWTFLPMAAMLSIIYINFGFGFNGTPVSELSIEANMQQYYLWLFKSFVLLYLIIQYCSFLEVDMSSGMMFHRYSLGFSQLQQTMLIILYVFVFTATYHLVGALFVSLRFAYYNSKDILYYPRNYGLRTLPNECIRILLLIFLTTVIYLKSRKSSLTFLRLFLIWLAESLIIVFDKYMFAYGIYKFLPLHSILSYGFLTEPLSLRTVVVLAYAVLFGWLFYRSIQKTKETIILNHFI